MRLLENISCYRADGRYELMYRLAWRTLFENPKLLEDAADPDVKNALLMDSAIRRDIHKMHAFVRFREVLDEHNEASYFAWFEPEHEILMRGSEFFVKRFPNMSWTIATPEGAAVWDKVALRFIDSPAADSDRPASDASRGTVAYVLPQHLQRGTDKSVGDATRNAAKVLAQPSRGG